MRNRDGFGQVGTVNHHTGHTDTDGKEGLADGRQYGTEIDFAEVRGGVRLIPLAGEGRDALLEAHPYYDEGFVPPGAYPGVDTPVATVAMNNWIVARADLDAGVVEHLLTILRDDRDGLAQVHEMARQIDLSKLSGAPIPLHPAAEVFVPGG